MARPFDVDVDKVPVMLCRVDAAAGCTWCNDAWLEFAGRPFAEVRGAGWLTALDAEDRARVVQRVALDVALELEVRFRRSGGRECSLLLRSAPSQDAGGAHSGHLLAAVDVSGWRDAELVLRFFAGLGDVLAGSIELDDTLRRVARLVVPQLADLCTIAVVGDDDRIRRVAIAHADAAVERFLLATQATAPLDPNAPAAIAEVVRTGTVLYRPIVDAAGPDEPWPPIADETDTQGTRSLICAPLRAREAVVGAIALVSWTRRLAARDLELVEEIAQRCATAIDNAGLYRRSEEARSRLVLLASIGEQLAATLELDDTIRTVVRRVVPVFADAAVVALRQRDGSFRRADVCHVDAAVEAAYRRRFIGTSIDLDDPTPIARAMRLQRPALIEDFGAELASASAHPKKKDAYAAGASLRVESVVAAPLMVGDEVLGAVVFGFGSSRRRYRSSDLPLALDIGWRAALAIDRAHAFDRERRLAETLQHSMLPDALPEVPGVAFCARYLTGGRGDVGGDWYDVVALAEGRLGLVIGDVAGHGVRAAAVMGQLRNALRAFATDVLDPATVVQRLNRFVFEQGPADMATLCYAVFDPRRGELSWTLAGHPPPLAVPPAGEPVFLSAQPAPPIGADPRGRFTASTLVLAPGTMLVLYTDGLVERRGESLDAGLERLARRVRLAPAVLDAACDDVIDHLLGGMPPSDDVALLGLRFVGAQRGPIRIRRPARATELAPVRRVVSAWLEATGMEPADIGVVSVAVSEAATNAIEHAYGPGEGWFEVEAEIEAGELRVSVRDEGRWRPKARGGGGRGLGLIGGLMDELEVRRAPQGTEIRMRRVLREPGGKD